MYLWFNYANDTALYLTAFPSYCTCLGFLFRENPIDLRQTNTELGNSCYSTPDQDIHSTSLKAVTMHLYWIRPLLILISSLEKKNPNTFKGFAQTGTYMREMHFKGSETARTLFPVILSPPLCSFSAMMRKGKS